MSNVPNGAAILLAFIGRLETGRDGVDAYTTIYGHRESRLTKPVTDFTLDELLAAQKTWGKNWGSSAAGKYQIIRKTLVGLVTDLGLSGSTKFSPSVQDQMGLALLKRRGFDKFIAGTLSLKAFAAELAKEWASIPVLAPMQGASRTVQRGQSYYAGDGLNKSLTSPGDVEAVLAEVLNDAQRKPIPIPRPVPIEEHEEPIAPPPVKKGINWWAIAAFLVVLLIVSFVLATTIPLPKIL